MMLMCLMSAPLSSITTSIDDKVVDVSGVDVINIQVSGVDVFDIDVSGVDVFDIDVSDPDGLTVDVSNVELMCRHMNHQPSTSIVRMLS